MALTQYARESKRYTPDEVREKLGELGVSVHRLARLVGVAPPSMYNFMNHKNGASRPTMIRIGEVLERLEEEKHAPQAPDGDGPRVRHL